MNTVFKTTLMSAAILGAGLLTACQAGTDAASDKAAEISAEAKAACSTGETSGSAEDHSTGAGGHHGVRHWWRGLLDGTIPSHGT